MRLAVGCASAGIAAAQPAEIRIIMPFPAGAAADSVARIVCAAPAQALGQPVIVDNRPGADGAIAAEFAAKSPADGHTLLFAGNTQMLGVPTLRKNPPYDPLSDFAPITPVVRFAFFLVVHPSTPAKTLAELIEHARAHPGKLNYASGNVNGVLAAAQLMSAGKLDMVHVPYKGEPLAVPDLLDGRVHLMFASGAVVAPLVREGKLRAAGDAAADAQRAAARCSDGRRSGHAAAFGPDLGRPVRAGERCRRRASSVISREVNAILKRPDVREQFQKQGVEPSGATPAEFAAFLKSSLPIGPRRPETPA